MKVERRRSAGTKFRDFLGSNMIPEGCARPATESLPFDYFLGPVSLGADKDEGNFSPAEPVFEIARISRFLGQLILRITFCQRHFGEPGVPNRGTGALRQFPARECRFTGFER